MNIITELAYQQQQASERYQCCRDSYEANKRRLNSESIYEVDSPSRVEMRRELLNATDKLGLERILGSNDLLNANYLEAGQQATHPVCRIQMRSASGQPLGFGTGFLVSPTMLMTNHHVLGTSELAANSLAEFDYETDINQVPRDSQNFWLDPETFFYSNRELDFALVAIQSQSTDGVSVDQYGYFPMIGQSGKALIGEAVSIIQHPNSEPKQIALRNNQILGLDGPFIHYETDTKPGSSGSPVLNDQWQLVALHHAGVSRKNAGGQILAKSGHLWQQWMGNQAVDWIANEGIRISAIVSHLQSKTDWPNREQQTINALLGDHHTKQVMVAPTFNTGSGNPSLGKNPGNGRVRPITVSEFFALVDQEETTEADLAPYIQLDPNAGNALSPVFKMNSAHVIDADVLEGDVVVSWLNDWAKQKRLRQYRRKVSNGNRVIKIVSEGDSWFQYPFLLKDVIDHLMDRDELAILSLGAAGDLLSDMVAKGEYINAIEAEEPDFFLISGGGNDLVGGDRLAEMLHGFHPGRVVASYPNSAFQTFEAEMRQNYLRLFRKVEARFPNLSVICHGYDYAIPVNGKWLGKPMQTLGIRDARIQQQILEVVIDRMNAVISDVASSFPNVTYLDLRDTVPTSGWFDELHPDDTGYGLLADKFARIIAP